MQPLSDITTECYIVAYSLISPNVKIKVLLQHSVKSRGKRRFGRNGSLWILMPQSASKIFTVVVFQKKISSFELLVWFIKI